MGRGKTRMGLISDRRKRAAAFATRKRGLLKMASELSTLCSVPVAVVLSAPAAGGPSGAAPPHHHHPPPEVWETEGVLERYRALPAEKRAEHTHLRYLEGNLGKEEAKLARVLRKGPAALASPDAELNGMNLDELREVLESVDAALLATAERKKALGLPEHDDDAAVDGPCTEGGFVGLDGGYYEMEEPVDGRIDHQAIWDANAMNMMQPGPGYYGFPNMNIAQPACDASGYLLDMAPGIGSNYHGQLAQGAFPHYSHSQHQQQNAIARPAYGGFQYTDGNTGYAGMGSSSQTHQMPSNVDGALTTWRTAEPCNAIVPAGWCPDVFTDNNLYTTAPGYLGMGNGGGAMNYAGCNDALYCSSNDFRCSGSGTTSQNSSNIEDLPYLRDGA